MPPTSDTGAAAGATGNYILAVDDEQGIVRLIKLNLERKGYRVDTAENGVEALELVRQKDYDLVISDVMMPKMDGMELLSHIRQDARTRDLPVIMLTAKSTDADITQGYMTGSDMYLTKPFSPEELALWVQRILGSSPQSDEGGTIIGGERHISG